MHKKAKKSRHVLHSTIVIPLLLSSALSITGLITGCATTGEHSNEPPQLDLSKYATLTTHDAVTNLESNFQTSDVNELAVFAPNHYSTAGKAIEDAKTLLAQSQPRAEVVQKVAVAEAVLKSGNMIMRKVKDILVDELTVKEKLDSLNTKSTYSAEYGSLNDRLNKLILKIESGNNAGEQSREKLLKDMQLLQRKSLRHNAMNEPREILKRVKYSGGEQLAPITFNEATAVFKRAEEFIKQNPNYELGITQIGREALFAAKRALYITEGVSALKQKIAFAPEQIILDEEYRMYRVARQLADLDYRDNSLEVQSELLAKEADSLALELQNKEGLVIALRDTLIKVRDSSSRLTMLSESAQRLKNEKNEWLAKEALFTAKVEQLNEKLQATETQLDSTQQTLLSFRNENTRLSKKIIDDEKKTIALQTQLNQQKKAQAVLVERKTHSATPEKAPEISPNKMEPSNTPKPAIVENKLGNKPAEAESIVQIEKAQIKKTPVAPTRLTTEPSIPSREKSNPEPKQDASQIATQDKPKSVTADENLISIQETSPITETNDQTLPLKLEPETTVQAEIEIAPPTPTAELDEASNDEVVTTLINMSGKKAPSIEQTREKITEQETLDALKSAKELIETLNATEIRIADSVEKTDNKKEPTSSANFLDEEDSDAFVDASE